DPSSIAWAFNIRGGDVAHTPLALGFVILAADGKHQLFMDQRKFSRQVAAYLTQLADPHDPGEFEAAVANLAKGGAKIALDPVLAAEKLKMLVEGNGGIVVSAP
ncbi:aminopeptidase P family N-terminal domain-containing protein, partial [Mesorhizobium sp.]